MENLKMYYFIRDDIKKIAYKLLHSETIEKRLLFFIEDGMLSIIDLTDYENANEDNVSLNIEQFIKHSERLEGKYVVVAHNHPGDTSPPSHGDFYAYKNSRHLYELNNTYLIEEFIVNKDGVSSYKIPKENRLPFFDESFVKDTKSLKNITMDAINETIKKKLAEDYEAKNADEFEVVISENLTLKDVENITLPKLLEGYEFFIIDNKIIFSKHFSLRRLYEITDKFREIFLFGVPNYEIRLQRERIENICHALGVIECFSNNQKGEFVPLLKEGKI